MTLICEQPSQLQDMALEHPEENVRTETSYFVYLANYDGYYPGEIIILGYDKNNHFWFAQATHTPPPEIPDAYKAFITDVKDFFADDVMEILL